MGAVALCVLSGAVRATPVRDMAGHMADLVCRKERGGARRMADAEGSVADAVRRTVRRVAHL